MNTRKSVLTISLLLAAFAPLGAQASNVDRAVDSCVAAFVDAYIADGTPVRVSKRIPADSPLNLMARAKSYTIALEARNARTGEQLAQARCVASRRGDVIVLDTPQPESYLASADFAVVLRK